MRITFNRRSSRHADERRAFTANRPQSLSRGRFLLTLTALSFILFLPACTTLKVLAYEGIGRDRWQQPDEVVQALEVKPGDAIADIGSGGGYFALRLAEAVGPDGVVYAADIDEAINRHLERRARRASQENIEIILADPDDPRLPESGVDLIFMCNTYHYLDDATTYFANVRQYLRDPGRVAIIDFDGTTWFHRVTGHWSDRDKVVQEVEAAGYELTAEFDFLDRQYFLVFSPTSLTGDRI